MKRLIVTAFAAMCLWALPTPAHTQCYNSCSYSSYSSPTYVTQKEYIIKKEYVPVAVPVSYPTVAVPVYSYVNSGYTNVSAAGYCPPTIASVSAAGYCPPAVASVSTYNCPTAISSVPAYGYPAVMPGYPQVAAYPPAAYQPTAYPPGYGYPGYPGYQPGAYAPQPGAYGSQPPAAASQSADQIADVVIRRLEQRLSLPAATAPTAAYSQPPVGAGPPAAMGSAPAAGNQSIQSAVALLTTKCASCHSGDASTGGGFAMFNASRQLLAISRERRWDAYDLTYQGTMPKNGPQLNDQEVELIRLWARQKN